MRKYILILLLFYGLVQLLYRAGNGETITVNPGLERIPVFVKDGAIVPMMEKPLIMKEASMHGGISKWYARTTASGREPFLKARREDPTPSLT